jgi:hypothetical protein
MAHQKKEKEKVQKDQGKLLIVRGLTVALLLCAEAECTGRKAEVCAGSHGQP